MAPNNSPPCPYQNGINLVLTYISTFLILSLVSCTSIPPMTLSIPNDFVISKDSAIQITIDAFQAKSWVPFVSRGPLSVESIDHANCRPKTNCDILIQNGNQSKPAVLTLLPKATGKTQIEFNARNPNTGKSETATHQIIIQDQYFEKLIVGQKISVFPLPELPIRVEWPLHSDNYLMCEQVSLNDNNSDVRLPWKYQPDSIRHFFFCRATFKFAEQHQYFIDYRYAGMIHQKVEPVVSVCVKSDKDNNIEIIDIFPMLDSQKAMESKKHENSCL